MKDSDGCDVGVVVVLKEELEGLKQAFKESGAEWPAEPDELDGHGGVTGTNIYWRVSMGVLQFVVCKTDKQGQLEMSPAVRRLIEHYHTPTLVLLGVSGGLNDSRVGDVVVADGIDSYADRGDVVDHVLPDGSRVSMHRFGGTNFNGTDSLVQMARHFEHRRVPAFNRWRASTKTALETSFSSELLQQHATFAPQPQLYVGNVASGHDVVKAETEQARLKQRSRSFLAVDTESAGFAKQVHQSLRSLAQSVEFIVLRGISDMAGQENKQALEQARPLAGSQFVLHSKPFQVIAAYNAARLLCEFAEARLLSTSGTRMADEYLRLQKREQQAKNDFDSCKARTLSFMRQLAKEKGTGSISVKTCDGTSLLHYLRRPTDGRRTVELMERALRKHVKSAETLGAIADFVAQEQEQDRRETEKLEVITSSKLQRKRQKPEDASAAAAAAAAFQRAGSSMDIDTVAGEEGEEDGNDGGDD